MKRILSTQSQNINQLDYNLLNTQDLIILNNILYFSSGLIDFLETYTNNGGSITKLSKTRNRYRSL